MRERTMVYLDREQLRALRAHARAEGVSLAELIRRLVKAHLEAQPGSPPVPSNAFRKIVAMGSSGRRDISERHDKYLAEAIRRDHAR